MDGIADITCTWIGNNPRLQSTCCKPRVPGRGYCEDHVWLVYQKGTHLSRRPKDIRTAAQVFDWASLFNEAVQELEEEGEL